MLPLPPLPVPPPLNWDLYGRVIDNFGDAGVCWRLAADLAARGDRVRLVIDDAAPLAFMAPQGAAGVTVFPWPGPQDAPGDVVIEAFGCDPPPERVAAMAACPRPPVWINLEYLSAESYVERSHGLPSPQACGITKWFFYPGFTERTGGLLREPSLMAQRDTFDRHAWLAQQGLHLRPGERVVSLFCYENPQIQVLLDALGTEPTLVLLTPGFAQQQVHALPSLQPRRDALRTHDLAWLSQPGYDRLLWASDLNFVRGEDSLARALWAGAPCVWQIYPQDDGAHAVKLQAMLETMRASPAVAALWWAWNGLAGTALPALPASTPWAQASREFRQRLLGQSDLATQLRAFVTGKPSARC
jgi:uncharacterized repeat protein (TIGR03837 family)